MKVLFLSMLCDFVLFLWVKYNEYVMGIEVK